MPVALLLSLLSILLLPHGAGAAGELPAFSGYVVDEAGVVPDDLERRVAASLSDYHRRSTNQVAVAVVRTTGGRAIEEYSLALANTWALGQRGKDNGVLVVIAHGDRRVRIEVGRGLESVLTDQRAAGIVNDGLVQHLGRGDVGGAVVFAAESIRRSLGDTLVAAAPVAPVATAAPAVQPVQTYPQAYPAPYQPAYDSPPDVTSDSGFPGWIFVLIPFVAVIGIVSRLAGIGGSGSGSSRPMTWGSGLGSSAWDRNRDSSHTSWGSSFGAGSSFGGGGGGGGSSDSGSSGGGGGGSFDGGGASGSW